MVGATRITGTVQRAAVVADLLATILHDVDLAAVRPADVGDVGAERPERGPDALATRLADPGFEATVRALEATCAVDARRRECAAAVTLAARDDPQVALTV